MCESDLFFSTEHYIKDINDLTFSQVAWKFLRRNQTYQSAFEQFILRGTGVNAATQWGLCIFY